MVRSLWIVTILLLYDVISTVAGVDYRTLVPARRILYNRRYKDYRTMLPKREVTCNLVQETDGYCVVQKLVRRDTKWQNIADLRRDIEINPPQPSTTSSTSAPRTTTPQPTTSKPKRKGKQKKLNVKVVKYVEVTPENDGQSGPIIQRMTMRNQGPQQVGSPPMFSPMSQRPVAPPIGPIPRWTQNQPPPWVSQPNRPPWAEDPTQPPWPRQRPKQPTGDVLDRLLAEDSLKRKGAASDEKWPLKGDSDRHRWESREGSDIYWELESTKKLATWDPRKTDGPIWKGSAISAKGEKRRKWEEELDNYAKDEDNRNQEWNENEHGGVPKPPLQYLKEYRRP